ncbi:multidrug effflux MFS transporter [Vibrio sp. SS-MA-C1-2]|uniref:multidrug effflux MFS transporter n=1 Tax=Vibrio sp. SS-MA-C1-2 TaxID=2908646 RepID=UPI001F425CD8|nr:multidrug effflux MFS transporter [Vibrio sp. SS-MA-C1-2]UJF16898.1 multidrug effflux MFS transporter [Vibrio sp. SS-MA-C1-2]
MSSQSTIQIPMRLVLLLASIFALSPYAIDSYLPAIPIISQHLNVETAQVSITVSIYVLGLAVGQLFGGPLSDRYGRRSVVVSGLIFFALCSYVISNVHQLESLWFWRLMQSIGGGMAVVCVPAIIRDHAKGREAAQLFSFITLIMMVAPSIAPSIGTLILKTAGWEWIFISMSVVSFSIALLTLKIMPKPIKSDKKEKSATGGFREVMKVKSAMYLLISHALSYSTLVIFITNASFVYMIHFGTTEEMFSMLFMANVVGIVFVNRLNSFLLRKHEPETLFHSFLILQLAGGVIVLATVLFFPESIFLTATGFVMIIASAGGTLSNSNVCYMKHFGQNSGTAAALLGCSQYTLGATISAITALLATESLWPIAIMVLLCTVLSIFFGYKSKQHDLTHPAETAAV